MFSAAGEGEIIFDTAEGSVDTIALAKRPELRDISLGRLLRKPAGLTSADPELEKLESESPGNPEVFLHGHISKAPFSASNDHAWKTSLIASKTPAPAPRLWRFCRDKQP